MARIFTISFVFNEESYNTMVSVKTTPFYIEYTLNNLDPNLLLQLPGNKIISPSQKTFFFPNSAPHNSIALMSTIIKAVSEHLQTVNF